MVLFNTQTKDDILELEQSYWDAMKAKDGKATAALSGKTGWLPEPGASAPSPRTGWAR